LLSIGHARRGRPYLAGAPSSALLWRLKLEVSGIFRKSGAFLVD